MARVVGVHGIAQQVKGESVLHAEWFAPMRDGVQFSGVDLAPDDLKCMSYVQFFRPPGRPLSNDVSPLTADDVTEGFNLELLTAWWVEAARVDKMVIAPDARSLMRTPRSAQAALRALSGSRFFWGLALRAMVFDLHQVRRYLTDRDLRARIQEQLVQAVGEDTRVLVAHSLESIVAYGALCAHPHWPVQALVTLGSPLGVRKLIFDRLLPAPTVVGNAGRVRGAWSGAVRQWTNVADIGDIVALVKELRPLFGPQVRRYVVKNGAKAHNVTSYLTAPQTGAAISSGLKG